MAMITVQVWDATGNKRQDVELPDDAPVNRILAVLLDKMRLPQTAPDGQPLSYKFHHKRSGKQLLDDQCLADVGVQDGDVLRLNPEITAGAGNGGELGSKRAGNCDQPPPLPSADTNKTNSPDDLLRIAESQKGVLICILLMFSLWLGAALLSPGETEPANPLVALTVLFGLFVLSLVSVVLVFRLAIATRGMRSGIFLGALALLPGLSLIALLIVNSTATRILKANGIRVGLLGANLSSISGRTGSLVLGSDKTKT